VLAKKDLSEDKLIINYTTSLAGEPIYDFLIPVWIENIEEAESDWFIEKEPEEIVEANETITEKIGFVHVGIDLKTTYRNIDRVRNFSILTIGLINVLLAIIFSLFLNQVIVNPIERFTNRAEAIADGDFEQKIKIRKSDEIGQLANSFDRMAEKLKKDINIIKDSEKKIKSLAKFPSENPNPILRIDLNDVLLYANEAALSIFSNWKLQVGQAVPEVLQDLTQGVEETLVKKSDIPYEECIFSVTAVLLPNSGYVNIYADDITERKKAEEEINFLAHSIRNITQCVCITDLENNLIFVNDAFLKTYGYKEIELIGKNIDIIRSKKNPTEILKKIKPETRKDGWQGELINKRKDGSEFPTFLSTSTLRDEDGKPIALVGVATDISKRKQTEEELSKYRQNLEELVEERTDKLEEKTVELQQANIQLQHADRMKSVFLANMSHELRTPLNSIIGFSGLILMGIAGNLNKEQKTQLTKVKDSAHHLLILINDILDISKIEAGKIDILKEEFYIDDVIQEVVDTVTPLVNKKGIDLLCEIKEKTIIFSDRRLMKQVLINLVGNAVKFTDKGSVKIKSRVLKTKHLEVRIIDTGLGIKKEDISKLFGFFQQVDMSSTKKHEGTGLGLYLSKKIVTMLGGTISVSSKYGKGSDFNFTFPIKDKGSK
jgi:PAS domain S-box-containing protein